MSLFSNWETAPKITNSGRVVTYSSEPTFWESEDSSTRIPIYYTFVRSSKMSFSIIGLSRSAAETGAKALQDEYTRRYMRWNATVIEQGSSPTVNINQDRMLECTSNIEPRIISGDDWGIYASINEKDIVVSTEDVTSVADFDSFFQSAEQREHTWPSGSVAIMKARWRSSVETGVVEVDYNAVITNFDRTKLKAQIKGANDTWTDADTYQNTTDGKIKFYSNTNCTFRLNYNNGGAVSDKWQTRNTAEATLTLEDVAVEFSQTEPAEYYSDDKRHTKLTATALLNPAAGWAVNSWRFELYSNAQMVLSVKPNNEVVDMGGGRYALIYSGDKFGDPEIKSLSDSGALFKLVFLGGNRVETEQTQMRRVNYVFINSLTCTGAIMTSSTMANYSFEMRYTSDKGQSLAQNLLTKVWHDGNLQQITDVTTSIQSGVYVRTFKCNLPINTGTTRGSIAAKLMDSSALNCSNFETAWLCDPPEDYLIITSATHEGTALVVKFVTDVPLETYLAHISIYLKPTGSIWMYVTNVVMGADENTVLGTLTQHFSEGMQVYIKIINGETQIQSNTVDAEVVS